MKVVYRVEPKTRSNGCSIGCLTMCIGLSIVILSIGACRYLYVKADAIAEQQKVEKR